MIYNIAELISDSPEVPKFIEDILKLKSDYPYFALTIKILGRFSKWISLHPVALLPILNFVGDALNCKKSIADAAAETFKNISRNCGKSILQFNEKFLTIFMNLNKFNLSSTGQMDLIKTICAIVNQLESDELKNVMREICRIQLNKILTCNRAETSKKLNELSEIFYQVTSKGASSVFIEFWPNLSEMMNSFDDEGHLEQIIECVEHAVVSYGVDLIPIFEDIIEKMLSMKIRRVFPAVLNLFSKIFFLLQETHPNVLLVIFEAVSTVIFQTLMLNEENLQKNLEKFFNFASEFFLKFPVEFAKLPNIIPTIELAILCCGIDSQDSSAINFIRKLLIVKKSDYEPYKLDIINFYAEKIINTLLNSSIFVYSDSFKFDAIAEIFNAMKEANLQAFGEQISKAILNLSNSTSYGNNAVNWCNLEGFYNVITR